MNLAIALIVFVALLAAAVLYLRQHHINLFNKLHATISSSNGSLDQALSAAFDSVHRRLTDIHTATQTPVTVALVSASPAAPAAPAATASAAPSQTTAAPTTTGTPLQAPPAQPASVVFNCDLYKDPVSRKQAAQDLLASLVAQYHNYNTRVIGPHGYDIDPQGNEIAPADPGIDTSVNPIPFDSIKGGVPVEIRPDQGLTKTVTGCPPKVLVRIFERSSDSRAQASYTGTVNGVSQDGGLAINAFTVPSNPDGSVNISSTSPGYQFNIQESA